MANEENQFQFARAGWRLAFLVPGWIAQVSMLLGLMGIFAYRLAETVENYEDRKSNGQIPIVEFVWECTNVGFSLIALILSILEISKMVTETLTPFFMLCSYILKLVLAFANLGLDIVVYMQRTDANYSIVGLAIDCGLLAASILIFIYSLRTFRRLLKYDDYDLTANKGVSTRGNDLEMGNDVSISFGGRKRASSVIHQNPSTSYDSQTTGLKGQIDRAIGAEFGWSTPSVERSSSVVGSGVVHSSVKVQPESVIRTKSWSGETRREGSVDEEDDDATVRGSHDGMRHQSVPTLLVSGHEEDESDTQALLPDGRESDMVIVPPHAPQYEDHPAHGTGPSS